MKKSVNLKKRTDQSTELALLLNKSLNIIKRILIVKKLTVKFKGEFTLDEERFNWFLKEVFHGSSDDKQGVQLQENAQRNFAKKSDGLVVMQ